MPIVSYSFPSDVVLVKGRKVSITLSTDRKRYEFSQKLIQFTFTASPAVDDTIGFVYGEVTVLLTVKNPADDSGQQFSTNAGALPLTDYLDLVALEMEANFDIVDNFEVTRVSTDKVLLIPRYGFDYDFVIDDNLTNCTVIQTEQVNANYEPNLLIYLGVEIYNEISGKWGAPSWHVLQPNINSSAVFDIHKDFDLWFDFPGTFTIDSSTFNVSQAFLNNDIFRVKYAEYYGDPAFVREITIHTAEFRALYGGTDYFSKSTDFWTSFKANKKFLSLQPTTKVISYQQPEWLYWIGKTDPDISVEVQCQATRANGDVDSVLTLPSSYTIGYKKTYKITSHYKQLGLTLNPANPIVSYQVWLVENGTSTKVSDVMTYVFENVIAEYERFFIFGNSLSGCDVVRGTGKVKKAVDYDSQLASQPEVDENPFNRSEYYQYNKKQITTFKGSLGYKDKDYVEYLKDMLVSNDVREINVSGKYFIPILVTKESFDMYKDDDDTWNLDWEYRYAFDDTANDNL